MTAQSDTEITLGTGKLLFLFFALVAICALFFALGYSLGRKADSSVIAANAATSPQVSNSSTKPEASPPQQPMTFYKAVEQKDANSELTSPENNKQDKGDNSSAGAASQSVSDAASSATLPSGNAYFVQVAAVTKQEDADALVDALKKKQYPAFVAPTSAADKLFRVQLGPFSEIKDAEGLRTRLISDGYNPILKK